jgi:hypothetical protein
MTSSNLTWPPVLGTPLSPAATRVLLLGAGELGKEVIIALQRLGVEVIAADRYPNAPGQQVAHRSHVLNMATRGAAGLTNASARHRLPKSRRSPLTRWRRSNARDSRALTRAPRSSR